MKKFIYLLFLSTSIISCSKSDIISNEEKTNEKVYIRIDIIDNDGIKVDSSTVNVVEF